MFGTALYLKQCSSALMQAYGGKKRNHSLLPCMVSLTRSGFPRIIPAFHRRKMKVGDEEADRLVQTYLSFFAMYRLVEMARPVSKETFKTIVSPVADLDRVRAFCSDVKCNLPQLWKRYTPWISTIPLMQGMEWLPTWKSLPNMGLWRKMAISSVKAGDIKGVDPRKVTSVFPVFPYELAAYGSLLQFTAKEGEQWISGVLWPSRVRYAFDSFNKLFTGLDLELFEKTTGPTLPRIEHYQLPG